MKWGKFEINDDVLVIISWFIFLGICAVSASVACIIM